MTERALTDAVMRWLKKVPRCFSMKIWGSVFTKSGMPDILIIVNSVPLFIELKVGRNEPTRLQKYRMEELSCAGAQTRVARSLEEVKQIVWPLLGPQQRAALSGERAPSRD